MTEQDIFDEWVNALQGAFSVARATRTRDLQRRRGRLLNDGGLHSYSEEWGRALACEALLPGLSDLRFTGEPLCTPTNMIHEACDEADHEWRTAA